MRWGLWFVRWVELARSGCSGCWWLGGGGVVGAGMGEVGCVGKEPLPTALGGRGAAVWLGLC